MTTQSYDEGSKVRLGYGDRATWLNTIVLITAMCATGVATITVLGEKVDQQSQRQDKADDERKDIVLNSTKSNIVQARIEERLVVIQASIQSGILPGAAQAISEVRNEIVQSEAERRAQAEWTKDQLKEMNNRVRRLEDRRT